MQFRRMSSPDFYCQADGASQSKYRATWVCPHKKRVSNACVTVEVKNLYGSSDNRVGFLEKETVFSTLTSVVDRIQEPKIVTLFKVAEFVGAVETSKTQELNGTKQPIGIFETDFGWPENYPARHHVLCAWCQLKPSYLSTQLE